MRLTLLITCLFAACVAQAQSLRVVQVHLDTTIATPKAIQFFCTQDYGGRKCLDDSRALRKALAYYPLDRLGEWSFVVVPSDDWKNLVRSLGGDPASPAFSIFEQRTTVMESSLFSASVGRRKELLLIFGSTGGELLDLAVTHELGHCICRETNEHRADNYGRELRDGKNVECARMAADKGK